MATQEQIFTHLLTTVLELDTEEVKIISKARYRTYSKFVKNVMYDKLDRLRDRENLSSCAWRELTDWTMYEDMTSPSYKNVITMTCETWDSVDRSIVRINHALDKTTITTVKPSVTTDTVFPSTSPIVVSDVSPNECAYDALFPAGKTFPTQDECNIKEKTDDNSHHLWDTCIFPSSELKDRLVSPATILKLLAQHDSNMFTSPLSSVTLRKHSF